MEREAVAVDLSSALEALRHELDAAWVAGQNARVRFGVSDVTLTIEVVARRDTTARGGLRWYVFEAGGDHSRGSEATQTLVLRLSPQLRDDDGGYGPLAVYGNQPKPGG